MGTTENTPVPLLEQELRIFAFLEYIGMYSVRDIDNKAAMQTREAVEGAKQFARKIPV